MTTFDKVGLNNDLEKLDEGTVTTDNKMSLSSSSTTIEEVQTTLSSPRSKIVSEEQDNIELPKKTPSEPRLIYDVLTPKQSQRRLYKEKKAKIDYIDLIERYTNTRLQTFDLGFFPTVNEEILDAEVKRSQRASQFEKNMQNQDFQVAFQRRAQEAISKLDESIEKVRLLYAGRRQEEEETCLRNRRKLQIDLQYEAELRQKFAYVRSVVNPDNNNNNNNNNTGKLKVSPLNLQMTQSEDVFDPESSNSLLASPKSGRGLPTKASPKKSQNLDTLPTTTTTTTTTTSNVTSPRTVFLAGNGNNNTASTTTQDLNDSENSNKVTSNLGMFINLQTESNKSINNNNGGVSVASSEVLLTQQKRQSQLKSSYSSNNDTNTNIFSSGSLDHSGGNNIEMDVVAEGRSGIDDSPRSNHSSKISQNALVSPPLVSTLSTFRNSTGSFSDTSDQDVPRASNRVARGSVSRIEVVKTVFSTNKSSGSSSTSSTISNPVDMSKIPEETVENVKNVKKILVQKEKPLTTIVSSPAIKKLSSTNSVIVNNRVVVGNSIPSNNTQYVLGTDDKAVVAPRKILPKKVKDDSKSGATVNDNSNNNVFDDSLKNNRQEEERIKMLQIDMENSMVSAIDKKVNVIKRTTPNNNN